MLRCHQVIAFCPPVRMSTCELCHTLVINAEDSARLSLEFTPDELQKSALINKCSSCDILLKGIFLMQDDTWSFAKDASKVYGYGYPTGADTLILEIYFCDGRPRLMLEIFCLADNYSDSMPWKSIKPRTRINGHPLSEAGTRWVKSRLDHCFKHHVCSNGLNKPLPARILAFERSHEGEIPVKLVEKPNESGRYAVLSHCWGSQLSCTTMTDNLSNMMQGISWIKLPQTFQDAIRYCLELGIFYLWIDALCILQDDKNDWQIESARMADIYQNSYISLAATSSDCSTSGCFPKQPMTDAERSFEAVSATGEVYQILIRRQLSHWSAPPTNLSRRNNPLLSRGWVFQERVLAPRILHFCNQELVWECGEQTCCECGSLPESQNLKMQFALATRLKSESELVENEYENAQERFDQWHTRYIRGSDSDPIKIDEARFVANLGYSPLKELFELAPKSRLDLAVDQWHHIVEQYSPLALTKDGDRLPALSGLAERMAPFLGKYLAGLWDKSLLRDLTWRVDKLDPGHRRPPKYRGPSWSWVSVNTGVSFWTEAEMTPVSVLRRFGEDVIRSGIYTPTAMPAQDTATPNIVSVEVRTEGKNPYGVVLSAILVVEGLLRPAWVSKVITTFDDLSTPPSFEVIIGNLTQDNGLVPSLRLPIFADFALNNDPKILHGPVYLFMLSSEVGLVLIKTSMAMRDASIYQRIGIMRVSHILMESYRIDLLKSSTRVKIAII
ncbi:HET-domain-containing protein [Hypoxylon sp. EC38]|nr:HET-domain-containing protein [Hypoxylon sp. EC38]